MDWTYIGEDGGSMPVVDLLIWNFFSFERYDECSFIFFTAAPEEQVDRAFVPFTDVSFILYTSVYISELEYIFLETSFWRICYYFSSQYTPVFHSP